MRKTAMESAYGITQAPKDFPHNTEQDRIAEELAKEMLDTYAPGWDIRELSQSPQHTPGPWRKKPDSCEIVSETRPICLVHTYGSDDKDWLANAALMVRAPGLLAENEMLRAKLAAYARLDESRDTLSVSEAGRKGGKIGGKVRSAAKTEANRLNARRPRKKRAD